MYLDKNVDKVALKLMDVIPMLFLTFKQQKIVSALIFFVKEFMDDVNYRMYFCLVDK